MLKNPWTQENMPILGKDLTAGQRDKVLRAFIHRDTQESPWNPTARLYLGTGRYIPTDDEWIAAHKFHFNLKGECYMAEPIGEDLLSKRG